MKLDRNGYAPSIIPPKIVRGEEVCYGCELGGTLVRHEVYFGNPGRQISKRHGFWVCLCPKCHGKAHSERKFDLELKETCQSTYEQNHTRAEFMALIGRNYLEEEIESDITASWDAAGRIQYDVSDKGDGDRE